MLNTYIQTFRDGNKNKKREIEIEDGVGNVC